MHFLIYGSTQYYCGDLRTKDLLLTMTLYISLIHKTNVDFFCYIRKLSKTFSFLISLSTFQLYLLSLTK
jgi:hypothetical protein